MKSKIHAEETLQKTIKLKQSNIIAGTYTYVTHTDLLQNTTDFVLRMQRITYEITLYT